MFKPIHAEPSKVKILVQAICVLHNFLRTVSDTSYTPAGFTDAVNNEGEIQEGFWRQTAEGNIHHNMGLGMRNSTVHATMVREYYRDYFMKPAGSVAWQLDHINAR